MDGDTQREILFYDGHCGLCHGAVKFLLKRHPRGESIRFAPLQGSTFENRVPEEIRDHLPDSMVFATTDGRFLVRSDSALYIARRLGGFWGFLGALGRVFPRPLRDRIYAWIARNRLRWFGTREETCPLVPPELRSRFLP